MADVGAFDIRCEFEKDVINDNVRDGFEKSSEVLKTVVSWGMRRSIMSRERFTSMQELGINTAVFWFRYHSEITLAHRFRDDKNRLFRIIGIAEIGRNELLEITAEEIQRNIS